MAANGTLTASGSSVTVYNVFSEAIAANTFITAHQDEDGYWVADAEDCRAAVGEQGVGGTLFVS